jgi:predicted secreted acid phosphatase
MTSSPTSTTNAGARSRGRLHRSLPVIAGAVIGAAGLTFGSLTAASAQSGHGHHGHHRSIAQQAAHVKAELAKTPKNGNAVLNVNVLEQQVENYFGSASATFPGVGTVTVASPHSNYAKQMKRIVGRAKGYLARAIKRYHGSAKPAVVFDIDDTLLSTYDYTLFQQFGYDPTTNATWVNDAAFPAVFHMPQLVKFAADHGYAVYFITGRPESQAAATVKDLTSAGYAAPEDGHLFLKQPAPPSYLHCAKAPSCTTIEYKSGTRKYISSQGYKIMADFGDQFSDLLGGDAGHQFKIPDPLYYLP